MVAYHLNACIHSNRRPIGSHLGLFKNTFGTRGDLQPSAILVYKGQGMYGRYFQSA